MSDAWQILRDGGLPLAMAKTTRRRSTAELAEAIHIAIASEPRGRECEALVAYVRAWAAHWPSSFGVVGDEALAWARAATADENRYLKLRRIALENLSTIL